MAKPTRYACIVACLALFLGLFTPQAHATPIPPTATYYSGTILKELDHISYNGNLYSLNFVYSARVKAASNLGLSGTQGLVQAAVDDLNTYTNADSVGYIYSSTVHTNTSFSAAVLATPSTPHDSNVEGKWSSLHGWTYTTIDPANSFSYPFAVFTLEGPISQTPEPNTAILVGLGLLCLIGLRRKLKGRIHIG